MKSGRQGWPAAGAGSAACPPIGADAASAEASGDVVPGVGGVEPASGDAVEPADRGVKPAIGGVEPDSDDVGPGEGCGKSED